MIMKRLFIYSALVVAGALALTSCGKKKGYEKAISGSEIIAVDESFQNVMEQIIPVFEYQYPDAAILARYLPENNCIDSLLQKKVNLIVATRELNESELNLLKAQKRAVRTDLIAVDAVAILANKNNPVDQLSLYDLTKILKGEYTDWSQVDANNKSGKIEIIFDFKGSSTINYLRSTLLDNDTIGGLAYAQNSNPGVYEAVQTHPGALGIIGVSWISSDMSKANMSAEELYNDSQQEDVTVTSFAPDVHVLPIAGNTEVYGVQPYQAYIYDGQYPLVRKVYMIVTGSTNTLQQAFYNFVTSFVGQKLMQTTGVIPGAIQPRIVQVE